MIRSPRLVAELEAREARRAEAVRAADPALDHLRAIDRFTALWAEARLLNPRVGEDWMPGVRRDVEMARALRAAARPLEADAPPRAD